jgi:hypothetical protein
MTTHYTAARPVRTDDAYSPGGKADFRLPNGREKRLQRALLQFTNYQKINKNENARLAAEALREAAAPG